MSDELEEVYWAEPGRSVDSSGKIVYNWPPEGRFVEIWERLCSTFPVETERCEALALLRYWNIENSTLVSYTDDSGDWVDVDIPDFPP